MTRYRKKPVIVEAVYFDGTEAGVVLVEGFGIDRDVSVHDSLVGNEDDEQFLFTLCANEQDALPLRAGEWVIRGVKGEYYPCPDDVFRATYESVTGPTTAWAALHDLHTPPPDDPR